MKNKEWKSLALEGSFTSGDLEGLIGIEELTEYDLETVTKGKNRLRKRKSLESEETLTKNKIPKKFEENVFSPGNFVCNPNLSSIKEVENQEIEDKKKKKKKSKKKKTANKIEEGENQAAQENGEVSKNILENKFKETQKEKKKRQKVAKKEDNVDKTEQKEDNPTNKVDNKQSKKKKAKPAKLKTEIGSKLNEVPKCTVQDLRPWEIIPLPDEILTALTHLGFTKPTPIQEKTLPPAILGRRDILGAAETGSGKTLAFGLPILAGIMNIKKKALESNGNDLEEENNEDDLEEENNQEENEDDLEDENSQEEDNEDDFEENEDANGQEDSDESEDENEEMDDESDGSHFTDEDTECMPEDIAARRKKCKPLYALILTPTRELAVQVKNHLAAIAKFCGINVAVVLGGMAAVKQERMLNKGPEIVVATPGRLWELVQQGNDHLSQIDDIKYLAIDETDRMLEKGHFAELHQLLERLNVNEVKRQQRQNFVFSATLTIVHDLPSHVFNKKRVKGKKHSKIIKMTPQQKLQKIVEMLGITDPKIVDVSREQGTAQSLTECRITCPIDEKDFYVYYFLKRHPGRTLIFCNSIGCVKRLATLLGILGCASLPLHACMQQRQRLKNLERFRDDPNGILVSTDVAARGLDIPGVEHVLHYQTPRTVESYVHRSGRTARALQQGITVLIIEPGEIPNYRKLCSTLNRMKDIPVFPIEERYLNAVKDRVKLARDLDKLELKTKRVNSETGWLQKAAQDMDILLESDHNSSDDESLKESEKIKRQAASIRKQLSVLISKPIFPKGLSFKYPTLNNSLGLMNMPLEEQVQEQQMTAVEVMKNEMENITKVKKTRKLYKPKKSVAQKKKEKKAMKAAEKKKKRKNKKERIINNQKET